MEIGEVGAQEEGSSNLFQGEAGSVGVEVHQAVRSQYGASLPLPLASGRRESGSCTPSIKPEHLWKGLSGMSTRLTDSAAVTTAPLCLLHSSSSTEKRSALH